jgi:hypothetical protein
MKIARAIIIGVGIWGLGVGAFISSFFIPLMENSEQQANIVLSVAVMPLVWLGAKLYYKAERRTHGYWVGQTFLLTAAVLDALITIPFLVIPNGGSHYEFFTDFGFWAIAFEFLSITTLYYYTRVYVKTVKTN